MHHAEEPRTPPEAGGLVESLTAKTTNTSSEQRSADKAKMVYRTPAARGIFTPMSSYPSKPSAPSSRRNTIDDEANWGYKNGSVWTSAGDGPSQMDNLPITPPNQMIESEFNLNSRRWPSSVRAMLEPHLASRLGLLATPPPRGGEDKMVSFLRARGLSAISSEAYTLPPASKASGQAVGSYVSDHAHAPVADAPWASHLKGKGTTDGTFMDLSPTPTPPVEMPPYSRPQDEDLWRKAEPKTMEYPCFLTGCMAERLQAACALSTADGQGVVGEIGMLHTAKRDFDEKKNLFDALMTSTVLMTEGQEKRTAMYAALADTFGTKSPFGHQIDEHRKMLNQELADVGRPPI